MSRRIIVDIISCLFIILFLYTGIYKILDYVHFFWALSKSPLLAHTYLLVGYTLPPIEVAVGLALLIPFFKEKPTFRKYGLYASAVLMTIFTVYIGYMLAFREDRPCTCGGIISQMNWHQHFYFNSLFTGLAILAIILNKKETRLQNNNMSMA